MGFGLQQGADIAEIESIAFVGTVRVILEARRMVGHQQPVIADLALDLDRLHEIHIGITEVIAALKPTCVAIEQLYSHYERPQTAILMGHARGVSGLAAVQAGLEVGN